MGEPTSLDSFIGKVLGNYRVAQLLDRHKWGPVFLANDRAKERYILRFLGNPFAEDRTAQLPPAERMVTLGHLQREAGNLAVLTHPHIVPQVDYGTYQGLLYLVYRYLDYIPVRSLFKPGALPDFLYIGRLLEQVASALEYAHAQGVVHRNLSTGCIFLLSGEQVQVGELGLLHLREVSLTGTLWKKGRTYPFEGSTESCAPEQLLGKPVDIYADIYAMGAVLYRLLTGYAPFTGETRDEILRQHLYAKVPPLHTWRKGLPVDLDHIIAKAMSKEPDLRFRRPSALVQAYYQIVAPNKASLLADASEALPADLHSHKTDETGKRSKIIPGAASREAKALSSEVVLRASGVLPKNSHVSRRRFVQVVGAGTGVAVAIGAGVAIPRLLQKNTTSPASASSAAPPSRNSNVLATLESLPLNSAVTFPIANQQNPGILVHLSNNQVVAYDSTCTHEQCEVHYNAQDRLLICPCHGAIFDPAKNGAVVQGPATKPLTPIKVVVNSNGTITAATL
jgi:serine/threonine protein kinase